MHALSNIVHTRTLPHIGTHSPFQSHYNIVHQHRLPMAASKAHPVPTRPSIDELNRCTPGQDRTGDLQRVRLTSWPLNHGCLKSMAIAGTQCNVHATCGACDPAAPSELAAPSKAPLGGWKAWPFLPQRCAPARCYNHAPIAESRSSCWADTTTPSQDRSGDLQRVRLTS